MMAKLGASAASSCVLRLPAHSRRHARSATLRPLAQALGRRQLGLVYGDGHNRKARQLVEEGTGAAQQMAPEAHNDCSGVEIRPSKSPQRDCPSGSARDPSVGA